LRSLYGDIRWSASYGAAAVRLTARAGFKRVLALRAGQVVDISLEESVASPKRVDLNGDAVITARGMGIAFGDE